MTRAEFGRLLDDALDAAYDHGDRLHGRAHQYEAAASERRIARAAVMFAWDERTIPPGCDSCGANETSTVYHCEHCGHSWVVPDEDRMAEMARRAEEPPA